MPAPDPAAPVVAAPDELDAATARDLVSRASAELESTGAASVVVDLTCTSFMDSTGLGALVDIGRLVAERGGRVSLREPDSRLLEILRVAGLDAAFDVEA